MNIIDRLYVGGDIEYEKLKDKSGWSFLRCCKDGPSGHKDILGYKTLGAPKDKNYLFVQKNKHLMALNMLDLDDPNFFQEKMINKGLDFINERMNAGDKVLVACNQGISRGPSMAFMYLKKIHELPDSFVRAKKIFSTLYPKYNPGIGINSYVREHWKEL